MIYILYTNINTSDEELISLQKYIPHLSTELQTKVSKYIFLKDKYRSVLGELLIRYGLYKKFGIEDSLLKFYREANGRPFVKNFDIDFSITHSQDYVVCAISDKDSIGIDIEFLDKPLIGIAKRFFSEYEYNECISKSLYEDKQKCFYDIWTKKESFYKMKNERYFDIKQDILQRNDIVFEKIDIDEKYICNICCKSSPIDISVEEFSITKVNKYFDSIILL